MLHGEDIICVSSIDWDFLWQGHQEIMATLAREGNRVLFVENTGVRAPNLRDLPRLRQRLRNWSRGIKGFRQEEPRLSVYSPLILPFPYSRLIRPLNRLLLFKAMRRWMESARFRPSVVWTFLPTPLARDVIRGLRPELTIYYCIDDLASSSPAAHRIRGSESKLFREADLVFVTSEKLRARAAQFNERVHVFPFGVDFDKFERARTSSDGVPAELRSLRRPVVGYVGGLHQWVDQELLERVIRAMPEASFVFVGPLQTPATRLARHPNVHLLGARRHEEIPAYIKGFDLGIVPYHLSEYTAHVYPTKLNEYLAMGIPVIATDLPEIRRFNAAHGDVVAVGSTPERFARLIQERLRPSSPGETAHRIDVARQNSWRTRIEQMCAHVEQELATRRAQGRSWEHRLRRIYRLTRHRLLGLGLALAVGYLVLFQSPFIWWAAQPLQLTEPARLVDAIVVVGGGVGESGKAGSGYQERVQHAVELYRQGRAPRIVFASGYTFALPEAEVMKELAVARGVPAEAILLETKGKNTRDQAVRLTALLAQHNWRSLLLVSSPYHMRRAVSTFRKHGPSLTVVPSPVPLSEFYWHGRGATLEQIGGILHEYLGIAYYWWKGWM